MGIKPTVDIVVPCYNVERAIIKTIKSLIQQDYAKEQYHCYFVNDASTDKTESILNSYSDHSQITIITHAVNRGLSATRNTGLKQSKAEFLCFLDGDMEVQSDWLNSMILYFSSANVIGVMGDNMMPLNTKPTILEKYYFSHLRGARTLSDGEVIPRKFILFGNTMLRRKTLEKVGGFDESFLHYGGEDIDLAFRIEDKFPKGFRFSNQSASRHYHPRSVKSFCNSMYIYGRENLPVLIARYPKYEKDLAGDWIHSLKGKLIFNFILRRIIDRIFKVFPSIFLVRYKVADAVITGAREHYKTKNTIA